MVWRKIVWACAVLFAVNFLSVDLAPAPLLAQQARQIRVMRVDTSRFPTVRVYFSVIEADGTVYEGLEAEQVDLQENGARVALGDLERENAGIALAILLDAGGNLIAMNGKSGQPGIEEARQGIFDLSDTDKWLDRETRSDYITVFVPGPNNQAQKIVPSQPQQRVTNDYNIVHNQVYGYRPTSAGNTPLFQLLLQAIQAMLQDPNTEALQKSVIVFSDGVNAFAGVNVDDVIKLARDNYISVHTVYHQLPRGGEPANLERIAQLTGGKSVTFNSIQDLEPIFVQVSNLRAQYVATYQSQANASGIQKINVRVRDESGTGIAASGEKDFAVGLDAPKVTIVAPTNNLNIERRAATFDAPVTSATPNTIPLQVEVEFPDNHPRKIVKVEYISEQGITPTDSIEELAWDISNFKSGTYTLRVKVYDELGLAAESNPITISVNLITPAVPFYVQVLKFIGDNLIWLALGIGIPLLVIGFLLYRRRTQPSQRHDTTIGNSSPTVIYSDLSPQSGGLGYLMVLQGESTLKGQLRLPPDGARLGREEPWANIVFTNPSVSRRQARIIQSSTGIFRIINESRQGTLVNGQPVGADGMALSDGNIITIGEVRVRIHLPEEMNTEIFNPNSIQPSEETKTEIYRPDEPLDPSANER